MNELAAQYELTVTACGAVATLILVQLAVADVAGIRARHAPGTQVPADPQVFLFRATRALANTNESIAAFILISLFGILGTAPPDLLGVFAWLYVGGRVGHMVCYYADWRIPRSVMFGLATLALLLMLLVTLFG